LSLELEEAGFDYSVLCECRQRLLASEDPERLLNQMLRRFQELKLLKARGKQRTDSTHVMAAIRLLNRLEMGGETLHPVLNEIAVLEPEWLKAGVVPGWFERYGRSFNEYRLPLEEAQREELALTIGQDGWALLQAIYEDPRTPPSLRELKAVAILRRVWLQQYSLNDEVLCWRAAKNLPPCAIRIQSPYDTEARYSSKRSVDWVGYKIHLTATCDEDGPPLISHVETTAATLPDVEVVEQIHAGLTDLDCLPAHHIVATGYNSAGLFLDSQKDYGIDLISPLRMGNSWQDTAANGFGLSHFQIDWERQMAICPMGKESSSWTLCPKRQGYEVFYIKFRASDWRVCAAREACTRGQRRTISIQTPALYELLKQKRAFQASAEFRELYRQRAGVEGTISQATWV